jgi:hypothetical protein
MIDRFFCSPPALLLMSSSNTIRPTPLSSEIADVTPSDADDPNISVMPETSMPISSYTGPSAFMSQPRPQSMKGLNIDHPINTRAMIKSLLVRV